MGEFTFDTSGRVAGDVGGLAVWYEFEDLEAFTQGYVEALFHSSFGGDLQRDGTWKMRVGFSDLAPETLARIMADCERFREAPIGRDPFLRDAPRSDVPTAHWLAQRGTLREAGSALWAYRNGDKDAFFRAKVITIIVLGNLEAVANTFPPLTVSLGDDGRVYLREAA